MGAPIFSSFAHCALWTQKTMPKTRSSAHNDDDSTESELSLPFKPRTRAEIIKFSEAVKKNLKKFKPRRKKLQIAKRRPIRHGDSDDSSYEAEKSIPSPQKPSTSSKKPSSNFARGKERTVTVPEKDIGDVSSLSTHGRALTPDIGTNSNTSPSDNPEASQPCRSPRKNVLMSPPKTIEGARLERVDEHVALSVPQGSSRRVIGFADDEEDRDKNEDPYDSDGTVGPFFDAVEGEEQDLALMTVADEDVTDHDPEELMRATAVQYNDTRLDVATVQAESVVDEADDGLPRALLTAEEVERMTVAQLKGALEGRGLAKKGNKPVLKARLLKALEDGVTLRPLGSDKLYPNPEDGFDNTAHWVPLEPSKIPVRNPVPEGFHTPTNRNALQENDLYEFEETFDRAPFTETSEEYELARGGRSYKKDGSGKEILNKKVREKGRPRLAWLKKNNLTFESHTIEWFDAMMTTGFTQVAGKLKRKTVFSSWTAWTNAKAVLGNFGDIDGQYPGFTSFKIREVRRFIGLLILNGLNVSPRLEYKFKNQDQDPVNGNNLCASVFGSNAAQRLKEFRAAFAIQDPMLPIPPRKEAPNHKIDPLLLHMQKTFLDCWEPGPMIAGDEQDAGFQGRHPDKQRVTFKKEGDGFLIDALCDDGFTMTFYFRNMPAPAKWV